MAKDGTLRVRIIGDSAPFEKTLGSITRKVGAFALGAGAAVGGMAAFSVKKFADFDAAMQKSVAIMGDVSDEMRGNMSDAAREVATTTTFSAEEAAESYFFLASAGMDAAESVEALPKVAAFAQAGAFDMAQATDLLTDAQSALGLTSDDSAESLENLAQVGDVLVKANTLANASVEQFASALTQKAGNAIKTVGKDLEEGTAALAVFADQGIKGERAGTLLTNTLFGLSDMSARNAEEFERLGVSVFDSEGNMNNLADIAGDLEVAFDGMSTEQQLAELSAMGFNKQAREGILALVGNSDALAEYEGELRNAGGTADEVANKQLDTFWNQLGLLKDQFLDVALTIGEQLMPHVMSFVETLQEHMPAIQAFIENALETMGRVMRERVIPAMRALSDWWDANGPAIVAAAQALWDGLKAVFNGVKAAFETVVDFFQSGSGETSETMTKLKDTFATIWEAITLVVDRAVEDIGRLIDWLQGLWERWGEDIMDHARVVWESIQQIIGGVLDAIQGVFEVFIGVFTGDWSRAWDGVKQIFSGVWDVITGLWDGILSGFQTMLGIAMDVVKDLWESAWTWVRDKVTEWLAGTVAAIAEKVVEVKQFFRDLPGQIRDALGNLGRLLWNAGRDLLQGLIGGITSKVSGAVRAVRDAVGSVVDGAKGMLGISSPSKVFMEIGEQTTQGLAMGLAKDAERVSRLMLDMLDTPTVTGLSGSTFAGAPTQQLPPVGSAAPSGGLVVNVNVTGTITSQDLIREVREGLQRELRGTPSLGLS